MKHRIVVRISRKAYDEYFESGGIISTLEKRRPNLDIYDAIEAELSYPSQDDLLVTINYGGEEITLPRGCVELVSRYEESS